MILVTRLVNAKVYPDLKRAGGSPGLIGRRSRALSALRETPVRLAPGAPQGLVDSPTLAIYADEAGGVLALSGLQKMGLIGKGRERQPWESLLLL